MILPSLPKHMPVETAKTAPTALTTNTFNDKKSGITNPPSIVLISGIPEPAAIYIVFPATAFSSSCSGVVAEGKALFVNIVTLALTSPNANAKATYTPKLAAYSSPQVLKFEHEVAGSEVVAEAQQASRV